MQSSITPCVDSSRKIDWSFARHKNLPKVKASEVYHKLIYGEKCMVERLARIGNFKVQRNGKWKWFGFVVFCIELSVHLDIYVWEKLHWR